MSELRITKDNFMQEVLQAKEPVLVDFWAGWCGPCKMLSPVIAQLADEYKGRAKVGKVNVDEEMELAQQFRVASIPTVIVFMGGKPVDMSVGVVPKAKLAGMLNQAGA